jgi:hypothetical protein
MPQDPNMPFVRIKYSTYENVFVDCPHCGLLNTFNRASDIECFDPIARWQVVCQGTECQQSFFIGGDLVNPAWQMLIIDCQALKSQKYYAYCILNLAQSFEVYLGLFLRVELLYKPYAQEGSHELHRLNELSNLLYSTIKRFSFNSLAGMFMNMVLNPPHLKSMAESEAFIIGLPNTANQPSDELIRQLPDAQISQILLDLKSPRVVALRHQVVHKQAYRPTLQDVESSIDETQRLLYAMDHKLGMLFDDLNHYVALANGG